jgi:predicted acylesterase/phospholipase RssA
LQQAGTAPSTAIAAPLGIPQDRPIQANESLESPGNGPNTLIIKGGGVKGLAFAGAVQVLEEYGFKFQTYVGTSAGAISAVLLAAGYSGQQLETEMQKQDMSAFLDPGSRLMGYVKLVLRGWIHSGEPLVEWLDKLLVKRFHPKPGESEIVLLKQYKDLGRRVVVYAAGPDGGPVTFDSKGTNWDVPAARAARFSGSIPGFFKAEKLNGHQYVYDGGSLNNFPVDIFLRNEPADKPTEFIGLFLSDQSVRGARSFWMKFGIVRVLTDVVNTQLKQNEAEALVRFRKQIIVINSIPIGTTEFSLTADQKTFLVAEGRAAALRFLAEYHTEKKVPAEELIRAIVEAESARQKILLPRRSSRSAVVVAGISVLAVAAAYSYYRHTRHETERTQSVADCTVDKKSSEAAFKAEREREREKA